MTDSLVRPPSHDCRPLLQLPLPAHVQAWVDGRLRTAWLIGRLHRADGLVAMVQYTDDTGREYTANIPADHITL